MVVTQEAAASRVGLDVLKRGGNAVDAAVAVGFALAVTLPRAGNIGGGGFMLIHRADLNETIAIDYREAAPAATTKDVFLDANGEADPFRSPIPGLRSGCPEPSGGKALPSTRTSPTRCRSPLLCSPSILRPRASI
jgi:gamma-glutamyltranspeptidase/glutathione hydrolase